MGNAVVHFEIGGPDDKPLVDFYGQLFGWNMQSYPGGGYTLIDTQGGGGINGGIGKSEGEARAHHPATNDGDIERAHAYAAINVSILSTSFGAREVRTSTPLRVTTTSSSIRMPML